MADNVIIKRCNNCANNKIEHAYQDSVYGRYNRVFIADSKGGANCTVCKNGQKTKK